MSFDKMKTWNYDIFQNKNQLSHRLVIDMRLAVVIILRVCTMLSVFTTSSVLKRYFRSFSFFPLNQPG